MDWDRLFDGYVLLSCVAHGNTSECGPGHDVTEGQIDRGITSISTNRPAYPQSSCTRMGECDFERYFPDQVIGINRSQLVIKVGLLASPRRVRIIDAVEGQCMNGCKWRTTRCSKRNVNTIAKLGVVTPRERDEGCLARCVTRISNARADGRIPANPVHIPTTSTVPAVNASPGRRSSVIVEIRRYRLAVLNTQEG